MPSQSRWPRPRRRRVSKSSCNSLAPDLDTHHENALRATTSKASFGDAWLAYMRWFRVAARMNIADGTSIILVELFEIDPNSLVTDAAGGDNSPTVMPAANYAFSCAAMIAAPPDHGDILGDAGINTLRRQCGYRRACQHSEKSGADRGHEKQFHCHTPYGFRFGYRNVVAETKSMTYPVNGNVNRAFTAPQGQVQGDVMASAASRSNLAPSLRAIAS